MKFLVSWLKGVGYFIIAAIVSVLVLLLMSLIILGIHWLFPAVSIIVLVILFVAMLFGIFYAMTDLYT